MSDLNESQRTIAETLDGMIVVDAGPGTGKTHTIVQRYANIVSQEGVEPNEVLLLTFTRNAAREMEGRVKKHLAEDENLATKSRLVRVQTFDSFCLSIVKESADEAGGWFGFEERLTHSARVVENSTLNRSYFRRFLDDFLANNDEDYGDWAAIASQNPDEVLNLIDRLMSCGVYPLENSWYGDDETHLEGNTNSIWKRMADMNVKGPSGGRSKLLKDFYENEPETDLTERIEGPEIEDWRLKEAAEDPSRVEMKRFVHDVYREYIRRSIRDDRLTFGLTAMLAFSILLENKKHEKVPEKSPYSFRYVMIDEFQDTNACQLMLALMILREPNLCVVGDWKQGIYGFRNVSIENITRFTERASKLKAQLSDNGFELNFEIGEPRMLALTENYRSSELIIKASFKCLGLRGLKNESPVGLEPNIGSARDEELRGDTGVRYVKCARKEDEADKVAACVLDYVSPGRYTVVEKDSTRRPMRYGDIAVLCRKTDGCDKVVEALRSRGIPAYLQGDVDIMSTREGKLALAWLRYVNNPKDKRGIVPIMADLGYSMEDCSRALEGQVPKKMAEQRERLVNSERRVNELLTKLFAFEWYGLNNDVTQAIINELCKAHRGSLLTISDLISIIENDIRSEGKSTYSVEAETNPDAVIVMTMHKAKGLEFPAVIIPYMDKGAMPLAGRDQSVFTYHEDEGLRCTKTVGRFGENGEYSKICNSWRTRLVKVSRSTDYSEERRLMFVAVSRAQQYVTLIAADPWYFMQDLSNELGLKEFEVPAADVPAADEREPAARPDVSGYVPRKPAVPVHGVMDLDPEDAKRARSRRSRIFAESTDDFDEPERGKQHGVDVHEEAASIWNGIPASGKYRESERIEAVVARRDEPGFIKGYSEMDCFLPLPSGLTLKGTIDLLLVYEDRVEVHDYKTDRDDLFENEYRLQLSIYAQAASKYYGKPAKCYIDYVSRSDMDDFMKGIEPMSVEEIDAIAVERLAEPKNE